MRSDDGRKAKRRSGSPAARLLQKSRSNWAIKPKSEDEGSFLVPAEATAPPPPDGPRGYVT